MLVHGEAGYEVEFVTLDGEAIAVVTIMARVLRGAEPEISGTRPVPAARWRAVPWISIRHTRSASYTFRMNTHRNINSSPRRLLSIALTTLGSWFAVAVGSTASGDVILDGSTTPTQQGWNVQETVNGPLDVQSDGNILTVNTIGVPTDTPSAMTFFHRHLGVASTSFAITFRMRVVDVPVPHTTSSDNGVMFMGNISHLPPTGGEGRQSVYFDENRVGWADNLGEYPLDTVSDFHIYRFEAYASGSAKLFVDGVEALHRFNYFSTSWIGFGDRSNAAGLDGRFQVDYITYDAIPEPAAALLWGTVALAAFRSRLR